MQEHRAQNLELSAATVDAAKRLGARRANSMREEPLRYGHSGELANVVGALAEMAVHQWVEQHGWEATPLYLATRPERCDLVANGYALEVKSGRRWLSRAAHPSTGEGFALKLSQWSHLQAVDAVVWCRVPDPPYEGDVTVWMLGWAPPARIATMSRIAVLEDEHDFSITFKPFGEDRLPGMSRTDRGQGRGALLPVDDLAETLTQPSAATRVRGEESRPDTYECGHPATGPACLTCWLAENGLPGTCLYDGGSTFHMTDDCSYLTGLESRVSMADAAIRASSCESCFHMAYRVRQRVRQGPLSSGA